MFGAILISVRLLQPSRRLLAVAVVLLLVAGVAAVYRIEAHQATAVHLPKALAQYRAGDTSTTSVASGAPPTVASRTSDTTVLQHRPSGAAVPAPEAEADSRPTPGVYSYRTSGSERLSLPGAARSYPSHTYATVRRGEGCRWTVDHPLLEEHVDHLERCTDTDALRVVADRTQVSFFGQTDNGEYRCEPPIVEAAWRDPTAVERERCRDGASSADYVFTGRGVEAVDVGGRSMPARRIHLDTKLHGRADGTVTVESWVQPGTGLILRLTRDVDTDGHSAFGDIHYTEHLDLTLESLTPRT